MRSFRKGARRQPLSKNFTRLHLSGLGHHLSSLEKSPAGAHALGPAALGLGVADALQTRCCPTSVTVPNFVTLAHTVWA